MSSGTSGRRSALDVPERSPSAGLPASAKVAVVLVGGLSITLAAFLAAHQFERRGLDAEFERMAGIHIEAVRRHLDTLINALGAVGGLLDVSEHVDRDQFERFVTPLLASANGLKAVGWIPRVTAKERSDCELEARLQGFDGFTFREEGPDDLIPAAERAVYFPVYYIVPYVGNDRALGFDLLSDPTRREALELARDSGRAVATAGIKLVQETGDQHSVLFFLPQYRPVPLPGEGGSQQGDFYGLISGVLRLGDVLDAALADITPGDIDLALIDDSAGGAMLVGSKEAFTASPQLYKDGEFEVGGRQWTLRCVPAAGRLEALTLVTPWLIMTIGLLGTAAATFYMRVPARRRVTESALRESEDRTRLIVATALDAVITMDTGGLVTGWNTQAESVFGWSQKEAVGQPLHELIIPERQIGAHIQGLERFLATGESAFLGRRIELTARHKNRHEFPVELSVTPIQRGDTPEFSAFVRDISDRKEAENALREGEQRFRILVENAPDAIVVLDVDSGRFVDVNSNAEKLFGKSREALLQCGPVELSPPVQPDGRTAADAAQEFIRCAVEGANPVFEWVHRGPDGDIPCEISLIRLPSAKGRLIRASITNISERKRAERRQHLLMQELDHRVKNNLAAVLALAEQTIAASDSLDAFQESYVGRIRTLARMHEALANSNWEDVQLDDVIRLNLGAFMENGRDRVAISGEKVLLPARASSPICMAIHELTTNATKYGALSSVDGRIAVDWQCEDSELTLTWTERGGPPVAQSTGRGFGMTLIKGMIEYELCGNVRMDFGPQGIECRFTVPLVRLKDEQRQEPS